MPFQLELTSVLNLVASVILCYDYLLTLRREVDFFWIKPRRSWMFVLYVANRYITILSRIPALMDAFWPRSLGEDGTFCKRVGASQQFTIIAVQIIGGIVMTLRVYALYVKSRRVLLFLVSVALAAVGVACWAILSPSSAAAPLVPTPALRYGCNVPITYEQAKRTAIAWGGQMSCDAIVFILTLWRTLRVGSLGKRNLLDALIRDGVLYFGLMTGANAANITAFLVCNTSSTKSFLAGFTNV
ncbi:hypothetical protein EDC04DRAFT_2611394 [Pisolithus marmoratus]|nr:hypothetical protein EDC04DRAFT_2611394 [Pisolithus marmoratus]